MLIFISSPSSFAQNLNCQLVNRYLSILTHIHFSLTQNDIKELSQKAALEILETTSLNDSQKEEQRKMLFSLNGDPEKTCLAVISWNEIKTDSTYEEFFKRVINSIDPHTHFLSPVQTPQFTRGVQGKFKGLGIQFKALGEKGYGPFQIIRILPSSPAASMDLQVNDIITHFNGQSCSQMESHDFIRMIQEAQENFSFTRQREDQEFVLPNLYIDEFLASSVYSYFVYPGLAYIHISSFSEKTGTELINEIHRLKKIYGSDLEGIILDLRYNSGGSLAAVIQTVDAFIDVGPVIFSYRRGYALSYSFSAAHKGQITSAPLFILINHSSASASEILAGSLQDYGRALVLGNRSYGKGTILNVFDLSQVIPSYQGTILFTQAIFHLPSGRSNQLYGIIPDIEIRDPESVKLLQRKDKENIILYESDHPNALVPRQLEAKNFRAPYQFGKKAKEFLSQAKLRENYSSFEQKDIQLAKSIDYLKILTQKPLTENHFGFIQYDPRSNKLHAVTDLYEKTIPAYIQFKFKINNMILNQESLIYETSGFLTNNEFSLSLKNTPVEKYMKNTEDYGSFILEITAQKNSKTYSHKTIVLF